MRRTRVFTGLAAVRVAAGALIGSGTANAAAAELPRCTGSTHTPYTDLSYSVSWSGTTEIDVKLGSSNSAVRSESYFTVIRDGTESGALKYTERSASGNGFIYENPINRPSVTAVQYYTYVGPDSDRWFCEFSIARP